MSPRALLRGVSLAALASMGLGSCVIQNTVTLRFDTVGDDVAGFNCVGNDSMITSNPGGPRGPTPPASLLTARANLAGVYSIVYDFLPVDPSAPLSSPMRLFTWCQTNGCTPIPESRFCTTLDPSTLGADGSIAPELAALAGQVILPTAPDRSVMVRAVAVAANCASLAPVDGVLPGFTPSLLMGCAFSSVVDLNDIRNGTLTLSLPTLDQRCERSVATCAGL